MRLWLARLLCPGTHRVLPVEPTKDMLAAAGYSMSPRAREGQPWVASRVKHRIRYQSMIRAHDEGRYWKDMK